MSSGWGALTPNQTGPTTDTWPNTSYQHPSSPSATCIDALRRDYFRRPEFLFDSGTMFLRGCRYEFGREIDGRKTGCSKGRVGVMDWGRLGWERGRRGERGSGTFLRELDSLPWTRTLISHRENSPIPNSPIPNFLTPARPIDSGALEPARGSCLALTKWVKSGGRGAGGPVHYMNSLPPTEMIAQRQPPSPKAGRSPCLLTIDYTPSVAWSELNPLTDVFVMKVKPCQVYKLSRSSILWHIVYFRWMKIRWRRRHSTARVSCAIRPSHPTVIENDLVTAVTHDHTSLGSLFVISIECDLLVCSTHTSPIRTITLLLLLVHFPYWTYRLVIRVPAAQGKEGKWQQKFGNLEILLKYRENTGNLVCSTC